MISNTSWRRVSRRSFLASLGLLATLSVTLPSAEAFPERPIRLVVGAAPGGIMDVVGRIWADKTKDQLKSIFIDNVPGAGSARGAAEVFKASPDGHTLFVGGSITNVTNALARSGGSYDPMGFASVSLLGSNSYAFVVNPSLPVNTLQELIAYARKNPGALSYGTPGVGTLNHLTGEFFKSVTKMPNITHVPYRSAGNAFTDLLSGHIPLAVVSFQASMLEFHQSGKIRILAVTSPERLDFAPTIPTTAEAGLAAINSQQFIGLFAPPNTSRNSINELASATQAAVASQDYRDKLAKAGFETFPDASPAKMDAINKQLFETWGPVIKSIGLKLD